MREDELAHLESIGEVEVWIEIAKGTNAHGAEGSQMRAEVEAWLRSKRVIAEALSSSKRDAREEETLSIARQARNDAHSANKIAVSAIIFSIMTAAIIAWYTIKYGK